MPKSNGKVVYLTKTTWDKLQQFRRSDDDSPGELVRRAVDQALQRRRLEPKVPSWAREERDL